MAKAKDVKRLTVELSGGLLRPEIKIEGEWKGMEVKQLPVIIFRAFKALQAKRTLALRKAAEDKKEE